jgi:hypothetical protein
MILIQQGTQIQSIYGGQGGMKALFADLGRIGSRLAPVAGAVAVIAAGFGLLHREIDNATKVNVSFMDTVKATFQVAGKFIYESFKTPLEWLGSTVGSVLDSIVSGIKTFINVMVGANEGVKNSIRLLKKMNDISLTFSNKEIDPTKTKISNKKIMQEGNPRYEFFLGDSLEVLPQLTRKYN